MNVPLDGIVSENYRKAATLQCGFSFVGIIRMNRLLISVGADA